MNIQPTISIIIPVYNVEEYIAQCLQSVMRQTYAGPIECIVVDDCGRDQSIAIAKELTSSYNGSIEFRIVKHDQNRGLSAARNTGLDASTGDYVYFLDSDDFIDANTIETLYNAIISADYAIAISYYTAYIDNRDEIYNANWLFDKSRIINPTEFADKMLMQQCNFASTAKLYNKKKVLQSIRFQEGRLNEDTLFLVDMVPIIEEGNYQCVDLPFYSYHYRMRDESICHQCTYKMDTAYVENIQIAIDRYGNRKELVDWLKQDQLLRCFKIVRDKDTDINCYMKAVEYMRHAPNRIFLQNRKMKAIVHLLLIKYMPHIMWHLEH